MLVPRPLAVRVQRARVVHVRFDALHGQQTHVAGGRRKGGRGRAGHGTQRVRHDQGDHAATEPFASMLAAVIVVGRHSERPRRDVRRRWRPRGGCSGGGENGVGGVNSGGGGSGAEKPRFMYRRPRRPCTRASNGSRD